MTSATIGSLLALLTLFTLTEAQNHQPISESRIINGTKVDIEDFPFMAAIVRDNAVMCSGFIVTSSWVATCAHCYKTKSKCTVDNTEVSVGTAKPMDGGRKFKLFTVVMHPSYIEESIYDDIALVKTVEQMKFTRKVQPAVLADANDRTPEVGAHCTAVGFGSADLDNYRESYQLRKTITKVIRKEICENYLAQYMNGRWVKFNMHKMFCIRPGKDYVVVYRGDSGGAVVCGGKVMGQIKNNKARPIRIPEGPRNAGAMNNLHKYRSWIDDTTRY